MLAEATRLNNNGQYGTSLEQTYRAPERLAGAYLFKRSANRCRSMTPLLNYSIKPYRTPEPSQFAIKN